MEDHSRELLPDRGHELLEHDEALVLVRDERIDLREASKVDALAEVVHLVEVLAPAVVDDLEEDLALEPAHELGAELLGAHLVGGEDVVREHSRDLLAGGGLRIERVEIHLERPDRLGLRTEARHVPLLEDVSRRELLYEAVGHNTDLGARDLRHVAPFEDLAAVLVDDAALLVHHVVVLEDALSDQEVLLLDLLLGALDLLREHLRLERVLLPVLVDGSQAVEDLVDAIAGEEADEVVLGREEEARLARVALAAGAAAELVVDPPRLVALGTADIEAAELADLVAFRLALLLERGQLDRYRVVPALVARAEALLPHDGLSHRVGVAAELDVDAAARHVRRDRDGAEATRLRDRLALALGVLRLRVEDDVVDPVAIELGAEHLGDLDRDRPDQDRLALLVALLDLVDEGLATCRPSSCRSGRSRRRGPSGGGSGSRPPASRRSS